MGRIPASIRAWQVDRRGGRTPAVSRKEVCAPPGFGHRVAAREPAALSSFDYSPVLNVVLLALAAVPCDASGALAACRCYEQFNHPIATHEPEAVGHARAN
jgi:hypothetical protein